jgi:hypothetical protein
LSPFCSAIAFSLGKAAAIWRVTETDWIWSSGALMGVGMGDVLRGHPTKNRGLIPSVPDAGRKGAEFFVGPVRHRPCDGYAGAVDQIVTADAIGEIRACFEELGLTEAVGGAEALDAGLAELASGVMPLVGELLAAHAAGVELSDAVFDDDRFPHLVRAHGFVGDVLVMDLPPDLLPLARRITSGGMPPEAGRLRRAAARTAFRRTGAIAHLARFAVFESLCLNQRLLLASSGGRLETINGRSRDVEVIAQGEVDLALRWEEYGAGLAGLDDPLRALVAAAAVTLRNHVERLREELLTLKAEVHEALDRRRTVLEVMDALPADQAVLVYNECAAVFGEQKLEAEQLRVHHPAMLGHLKRDGIYQRVHRLPERIERLRLETVERRSAPSLADVILGAPIAFPPAAEGEP